MYPPLSLQMGVGMDMTIFAIHLMGASSIMGAINIITTILNMRAPGMTLMKLPMFCWTWLITAYLLIAVMPVLATAVTMMLTDRHFGTTFFNAAGGGDPVMFQHIFWFFGHPEVYIMILPGVRHHLADHSRVLAQAAVRLRLDGVRGGVDRHHLLHRLGPPHVHHRHAGHGPAVLHVRHHAGRGADRGQGVQLGGDHVEGIAQLRAPMLFAVGFIWVFTIGGFSGLILSVAPIDIQVQDTYYVVAHFHYVLVAGSLFALFGGYYYWVPQVDRAHGQRLARQVPLLEFADLGNVTFFPMHFLGLAGMPRRYADYAVQFTDFHMVTSIGAWLFGLTQVYWLLVHRDSEHPRRAAGAAQALGRRGRAGVDGAQPGALPYLRDTAGGDLTVQGEAHATRCAIGTT
jgi:cytochrome c oxidase subunit 1